MTTTSFLNKKHVHSPPNGKAQRCTQHLRCQRQLVGIPCCPQTDFEAHWSHTTLLVTLTVFLLMILHENFSTHDPTNARDGYQVSIFWLEPTILMHTQLGWVIWLHLVVLGANEK